MDTLKCEKENEKVCHCHDIDQILSEICGISRKKTINIQKETFQPEAYNFIKNETPALLFSCKFSEMF